MISTTVTAYGDGMVERVGEIASAPPDLIFDTAPISGVLRNLVKIVGGDPRRVLTCTDFAAAAELGVRSGFGEEGTGKGGSILRYDVLGDFAQLAAEGRFTVPIARTFALADWRQALDVSQSGHAHGKLLVLPARKFAAGG